MAILFLRIFLVASFIKTVILGLLLWHDTYDDAAVWYLAIQTLSSVALIYYRDTHLQTARKEVLNAISPIMYSMRTIAIGLQLMLWYYYHERKATFAFLFMLIFVVEVVVSAFSGISVQTYKNMMTKKGDTDSHVTSATW
jgi:hypothetical protein